MATAGVNRADLYLSWWFTVASADSLAGNVLAMRDDAFGRLNGEAPKFEITGTRTTDLEPGIAKIVEGTYEVPLYLTERGRPGARAQHRPRDRRAGRERHLHRGVRLLGARVRRRRTARRSRSSTATGCWAPPTRPSRARCSTPRRRTNALYCATNWIGLAEEDIAYAIEALSDISKFPSVADRLQQSMINTLYLGRLMIHLDGLGNAPGVPDDRRRQHDQHRRRRTTTATARAPSWAARSPRSRRTGPGPRSGVGGMNYSTLLNRSVDFDEYAVVLRNAYPNALDQQLVFGVLQMLWDRRRDRRLRAAPDRPHLRPDPAEGDPDDRRLRRPPGGEHHAQNIARTLNIKMYQPALPIGATIVPEPFYGIDPIPAFPYAGSALFYWDCRHPGAAAGQHHADHVAALHRRVHRRQRRSGRLADAAPTRTRTRAASRV